MIADVVDGRKIARNLKQKISVEIKNLVSKYNVVPNITTIIVGDDPSSKLYLRLRDKACEEVGIKSNHIEFSSNASEEKILQTIEKLNNDDDVHGILIQFPVPSHISQDKLINKIDHFKDVEGFNPYNMGQTLNGDEYIVPCTPLSVLTILEYEKIDLKGKDVVIINHSNIVGKPLAALFLNRNATVSVCHIFTKDIQKYTSNADIIVTATGVPKFLKKKHVKNHAFVIDVGIIPTKDGVCGDVDFHSVKEIAGKITPVPGGVGPVTVACSLINMVKTYKNCTEKK